MSEKVAPQKSITVGRNSTNGIDMIIVDPGISTSVTTFTIEGARWVAAELLRAAEDRPAQPSSNTHSKSNGENGS